MWEFEMPRLSWSLHSDRDGIRCRWTSSPEWVAFRDRRTQPGPVLRLSGVLTPYCLGVSGLWLVGSLQRSDSCLGLVLSSVFD